MRARIFLGLAVPFAVRRLAMELMWRPLGPFTLRGTLRSVARVPAITAAAASAAALVACSSGLPRPALVAQPASVPVVVPEQPPPALVETVPPRPAPRDAVWIDGEWTWARRRWTWVPGRWVVPPPGATYAPWMTVTAEDGTVFFAAAGWRAADGTPSPAPTPVAVATVIGYPVVTRADGETTRITVKPP